MNYLCITLGAFLLTSTLFANDRGLSIDPYAKNNALLVSAANGLPGLEYDIENVEKMALHPNSKFSIEKLADGKGTVARIATELSRMVDSSDEGASHFFYFTGHGGRGTILAEDRSMKVDEIKKALLKGREKWGPMARLTFMLDSCYSGSVIDPLSTLKPTSFLNSPQVVAQEIVDSLVEELSPKRNENPLFKSLFAFVSAQNNETCLAGSKGSAFTVAMMNAWNQAASGKMTVAEFISATQKGTKGSHPTARLIPMELAQEVLVP